MEKTYTALVKHLYAERQLLAHALFLHKPIEERVQTCEDLLKAAIEFPDKESARRHIDWLMRASDDCHLVPVAKPYADAYLLPETEEVHHARERALIARADLAIRLYTLVPTWITKGHPWQRQIEMLTEALSALLGEITIAWRDSASEEESDRIFAFLNAEGFWCVDYVGTSRKELCAMIKEVVRATTDRRFPAERLGRHLVLLGSNVGNTNAEIEHLAEIRRLFAIAWARNSDFERLQLVVQATSALPGKSAEAFRLLRSHAERIADLERVSAATRAQWESSLDPS